MIAYTLTNNSITVVLKNKVYTVSAGQPQWEPVLDAIRNNDEQALQNVLSVALAITSFTEGHVTVKDNQVFYRDVPLDNYVVEKVLEFSKNKLPLQPILRFINNLMKNPSRRAVQELYKFLEHKNMPITPDGNFLAYKGIQSDYYSKTAGTIVVVQGTVTNGRIYNGIGEVIEVERNGVCDDKNLGCSAGLHAGSVAYATSFVGSGGKVVLVEINPADVVSVPNDCECQKLRACKYKVVGEYELPLDNHYNNAYSNEDWNDVAKDCSDDESNYDSDDIKDDVYEETPPEQPASVPAEPFDMFFKFFPTGPKDTKKSLVDELQRLYKISNGQIQSGVDQVKTKVDKVKNTVDFLREFAQTIAATKASHANVAAKPATKPAGPVRDAAGRFKKKNG